ncbi:MAG: PAS domain S-box protein [Chitinophagales bacterium]
MGLINSLIRWIIPQQEVDDTEKYRISRFTAIIMMAAILLGVIYFFIYVIIRYWVGIYSMLIFTFLAFFVLLGYRKYGNVIWVSNAFSFFILLMLFILIFTSGGLYSPVMAWLFVASISFFWYINKNSGIFWTVICFLILFLLFALNIYGYEFTLRYDEQYQPLFTLFSLTGLFMYLLTIFSLYEKEHTTEKHQLNITNKIILEKNQELEVQRAVTEEKSILLEQAYQRLEEQKDHYYQKLIENGSEVLAIVDNNGIFKFVSSTIESEFGYKPCEILNESGFLHIHPDDLEELKEGFRNVLEIPGKRLRSVYRYQHKDGAWYYVENFAQNFLNDKDIEGVVINFRNINDYIENQRKISEKERYYRSLIENSSDIISIIDAEGRYQYLSPSFEKQFGHYAINFIGEDAFQYIHSDDREEVRVLFENVKKAYGWQMVIKKLYRTPDSTGKLRYLESAAHNLINDPIIKGVVVNTRIVDEKVMTQQRLESREKYYRSLIENSMDMITVRDESAVITYCSPSTKFILGYKEEELIGKTGFHLVHPDDIKAAEKDWIYLMMNPNEVIRIEQRVQHKDGKWVFIEARITNLLNVEGVGGVVSNFSDITKKKEAEQIQKEYEQNLEKEVALKTQLLKEQNDAVEGALNSLKNTQVQLVNAEKMASLGQLTAGIAHEINNPINFVSANIHPLKTDFQDLKKILEQYKTAASAKDKLTAYKAAEKFAEEAGIGYLFEEMQALIEGIEEGANRTRDIVLGLRNFSRLDEDGIKYADIHSGINATLVLLKNETKKNIKIVRKYDTSLKEIECYPGKLNQVFMNLLTNAIQAVEGKGTITITTQNDGNYVKIKVKDTGVGMTEEVKEKIFEPFFTTKDIGKGTGLGLSITYGIVEQHKGKIIVNTELGKGSEFVVILPKLLHE